MTDNTNQRAHDTASQGSGAAEFTEAGSDDFDFAQNAGEGGPANDQRSVYDDVVADQGKSTAELEAEIAQLKDRLLRALAEAENTRRRMSKEVQDAQQYGAAKLAKEMVQVADDLNRAVQAAQSDKLDEEQSVLLEGVVMIEKSLHQALERHGVVRIEPVGDRFDPNQHQAVAETPSEEHAPGHVVEVLQPGYILGERTLRPAQVVVSKGQGGPAAPTVDVTA